MTMNLFGKALANDTAVLPPELQNNCRKTITEIERCSQSLTLEQFCEDTVASVHHTFNLYSANLYMVKAKDGWVILLAGTSKTAQEAIQKGHKLPIGGNSLISTVVQTGQGRITQEKQVQMDYYPSPTFPLFHSELAVPIILPRNKSIIGVLDIQSEEYEAFGNDEYAAFSIIATCIALVFNEALPGVYS
jgi:signal transduction protein with GAF and PtsI domain